MLILKLFAALLLLLFIHLQYQIWQGDNSYITHHELQQLHAQQQHENQLLQQRNQDLLAEVNDLKNGFDAVEERARMDLGFIKPGEVFYQIVD